MSSIDDTTIFDEAERQFFYIQALKKLSFFLDKNFKSFDENDEPESTKSHSSLGDTSIEDEDMIDSNQALTSTDDNTSDKEPKKAIDIINHKINKLDALFTNFSGIKAIGRPSSYEVVPDIKTKEAMIKQKEKEEREVKRFAGIYSMKTVIYDMKTNIPPALSMENEEPEKVKAPKLVELYQFTKYDNRNKIDLPHEMELDQVLNKVLDSIVLLKRQPHYKVFLHQQIFSDPCKYVIHDTFWWCFLERYQKMPTIQYEYFQKISENYVKLLFTEMDFRYRDSFFKSFADLVAMSVYTIFCSCFPDSHMTHFNDDFKEFICRVSHCWITGVKPTPRTYSKWNFKVIDPPSAVFAKEVLNKKQTNIVDVASLDTSYQQSSPSKNQSRTSHMNSSFEKKSSITSSLNKRGERRDIKIPSILSEAVSRKSIKTKTPEPVIVVKKESHPACRGMEVENCLFDILGKSPLVEYYFYNHNARKVNSAEVLIQHSNVTQLPPINSITYNDIINESLRNIKKIEKEFKTVTTRQKNEFMLLEKERAKFLREHHKKTEMLLSKPREVQIMGELLTMNSKKDPNTTNFGLDSALKKAFSNASRNSNY